MEMNKSTTLDNDSCTTVMEANGNVSSLPLEILLNIFSFFSHSVKDLLTCAQVNQAWHHVVTSFYIWHTTKFDKFEVFLRFHEVLQLIANTRRKRAIDNWSRFVNAYLNTIEPSTSETSKEEDERRKDIGTPISFAKPTYFHSTKFYGHFVRKLDLSGINRKFLITEEILCDLFPNIPNLENINFYNCYTVTDKVIKKLTETCHHLKKLKLFGCTSLTNRSLCWIETRCTELSLLNIGFCTIITSHALQSLVNKCKELTSLTISHCLNAPAISLIPTIPRLRKLDLGVSNPKLTDETAEIISQHCPNLVHLSLSFSLITSQGLRKISQGCKKLLVIDLSGCYKIDEELSNFLNYSAELKIIYLNYLLQLSGKSFSAIIRSSHVEYASFSSSKILEVPSNDVPSSDEEKSNIKKLVLDNCEISDENLRQIAYCCKNLEYLDLSMVLYDMPDETLQFLCDHLENLKEVIAKNCYGVSVAKQAELRSKHQSIRFTF